MINRSNYRLVKQFLMYQREVMQLDTKSIDRYWSYLKHLRIWADAESLSQCADLRPSFAVYINSRSTRDETSRPLAALTRKKILQIAKRLFTWAKSTYPHEFRSSPTAWIDALRLPHATSSQAEHEFVTLSEVLQLIAVPRVAQDLAMWRDQAAAALLFLSGARAAAFGSLSLDCVDLSNRTIQQLPSLGVKTKNHKSGVTFLLEIPELLPVVEQWDTFVRSQLPLHAMWDTPTINHWGEQTLSMDPPGENRNIALAKRLRRLFSLAGLPPKSPHAFRHGHAVFALQHARTMADYKAVSMNLMHGNIQITDQVYAPLASAEVKQRVTGLLPSSGTATPESHVGARFADQLTDSELAAILTAAAGRLSR